MIPTNITSIRSPILFIVFNRYSAALQVFKAIKKARPPRLYFAADGARTKEEWKKCNAVRSIIELVDWPCEVFTLFSNVNLGVKLGETAAMDWFFENEEEGIILEDDTFPDSTFFPFCDEMLEKYRDDTRIWNITCTNHMTKYDRNNAKSYHFTKHRYGAYWGWACWRRVWVKYDVDMKVYPKVRGKEILESHFLNSEERDEVYNLLDHTLNGNINSWDYQMDLARIINQGYVIIPNMNLISNIGFGQEGTHTVNENDRRSKNDLVSMEFPLDHPEEITEDFKRDELYFRKYIRTTHFRRFKNLVKNALPSVLDEAVTPFFRSVQKRMGLN